MDKLALGTGQIFIVGNGSSVGKKIQDGAYAEYRNQDGADEQGNQLAFHIISGKVFKMKMV